MLTESNNSCFDNGTMFTISVINVMQIISDVGHDYSSYKISNKNHKKDSQTDGKMSNMTIVSDSSRKIIGIVCNNL
jgi:hypothetical protein